MMTSPDVGTGVATAMLLSVLACTGAPQVERATLDEAGRMLDRAVAHYQSEGRERALSDFTAKTAPFVDRDLYVFCYGPDRTISAHGASADLVGEPIDDLRDVDGQAFGTRIMEVATARPEGGRVPYKWLNPASGVVEPKISIVRHVGEDVCGVGAYDPGSQG